MRQRYEIPEPGQPFDPAIFRLGSPCKRRHLWDEGVTLRTVKGSKCPLCQRIDALDRIARQKADDPEAFKAERREAMRRRRETHGRVSRSKYGLPYTPHEIIALRAAIRRAGYMPSVARLVYDQQLEHWTANPDDRAEFLRQYTQWRHRWRYAMEPSFRLYHRAKSKQRKARERGSRTVMLSGDQMWRRWVEFGHRCAYCGADGDLQVEHVMPISQGGEHHLGNIVPACQRCNYSKATASGREWYESQPFFSETRWFAILEALDRGQPDTEQLPLL
jgi:5-methylcytosine-specific restriction endonuclease McrA